MLFYFQQHAPQYERFHCCKNAFAQIMGDGMSSYSQVSKTKEEGMNRIQLNGIEFHSKSGTNQAL